MQCECHPFFPQTDTRKITEKHGIKIMSWYPLGGKGQTEELLNSSIIKNIAEKYGKSPAQIVLRWHIQMGFIVIPGSKNPEHIKSNIDIYDFALSEDGMNGIAKLNNGRRRYIRTDEALKGFALWKPQYEK